MKIAILTSLACTMAAFTAPALLAGDDSADLYGNGKQVIVYNPDASKAWGGSVTAGWDSLYMHNGVNMLGGGSSASGNGWTLKQK
jgi:hypothetical protein